MTDHSEIERFRDIVQMSKSGAWLEFMQMVQSLVDESHESIVGCMSFDSKIRMGLDIRYQQRIAFVRAIHNWIESAEQGLDEITESMRQDLERLAEESSLV